MYPSRGRSFAGWAPLQVHEVHIAGAGEEQPTGVSSGMELPEQEFQEGRQKMTSHHHIQRILPVGELSFFLKRLWREYAHMVEDTQAWGRRSDKWFPPFQPHFQRWLPPQ